MKYNLFRSLLFVPAYSERYIKSAFKSETDVVILDLEDSVPISMKNQARENISNIEKYIGAFSGQVIIRINELTDQNEVVKDIKSINQYIDGLMLPKIINVDDIYRYETFVRREIENNKLYFIPLIENAKVLFQLENILMNANVRGIAFGGEDFITDINGLHGEESRVFNYPRAQMVIAAKAYGKLVIDTPFLKIDDFAGVERTSVIARELGFDGKLSIHPLHSKKINQIFSPSIEELIHAKKILKLIKDSNLFGKGVAMIDGKMVGPPMEKRARKIVEMDEQIKIKSSGNVL